MSRTVDLSVVVVSYNTRELLRACLAAIARETRRSRRVIETLVVDSGSTDGTFPDLAGEFLDVRWLPSRENLGFTRGNNRGLRAAVGRSIALLNPDTVVGEGALDRMADLLDANPDVGAVGPRLLFPDGTPQPSRRRFPRRSTAFVESTVLQRWLGWLPTIREFYVQDRSDAETQDVDWVVGAAMTVRADALRDVGLFDERFFMYSEEVDLCHRLRAGGWRIVYLPDAVVVHHEGKSSEQNLRNRNLRFHESRFRYYRKYFGRPTEIGLRLAILGHFAYSAAEEAAKLVLVGRNRPLRRQRLATIRSVLDRQARDLIRSARGAA